MSSLNNNPVVNELLNDKRFVCLSQPVCWGTVLKCTKYQAKFAPAPQSTEDPVYVSVIWSDVSYKDGGSVYCDDSSVEIAVMQHGKIISGDVKGWVKSADEVMDFYNETMQHVV